MNIKKLFPENKVSKKGLLEFLDKKGFYIILILCIAIVATTAVFVTTRTDNTQNIGLDDENLIPEEVGTDSVLGDIEKETVESSINTAPSLASKDDNVKSPTASDKQTEPKKDDSKQAEPKKEDKTPPAAAPKTVTAKTTAAAKTNFVVPVFGDITFDYSKDKLVYSKTLDDWRTHVGIDVSADRGTIVRAVADGVVSEIKNDPRYGILVILDHSNGIKTVYANLASDDVVSPNQKIKQGQTIGSIGNTANFESIEESHLHFEVWKDNEAVDPNTYLAKK